MYIYILFVNRKPDKTEEVEPATPCPYCDFKLAETELACRECKNEIPYCIITVNTFFVH